MLADELLAHLVCPQSHGPLIYFPRGERDQDEADGFLVCPASRLRYRVEAGVPVLLVDEAEELSQARVETLISRARDLGFPVPT